jgi:hypothetical protein
MRRAMLTRVAIPRRPRSVKAALAFKGERLRASIAHAGRLTSGCLLGKPGETAERRPRSDERFGRMEPWRNRA